MNKKTWLIKRDPQINNSINKAKKKGIQWYTETRVNAYNKNIGPSGSNSKKNDEVYVYQKNHGVWAKGKILEGGDNKDNFHEFTSLRDVIDFSETKAKYKNRTYWGNTILEKLSKKKDGEFRFIVLEIKLELETLEREIFIHDQKIPSSQSPWTKLQMSIEDLKVKKGELSSVIPPYLRNKLLSKYNHFFNNLVLDIDHHVPQSIGGPGNIEENLVPLPPSANRYKGAKIPEGLFKIAESKDYRDYFKKCPSKFFNENERKKYINKNDLRLLTGEDVKNEARKIVAIINDLSLEEAKEFYNKVRKDHYPHIDKT